MYLHILSKLVSETLLSLYPVFVKFINIPLELQLWSRFLTYILFSCFFINFNFVFKNLLSKMGLLLSFVTLIHVYFSYKGFQLLESGIAYTLFYTYPIIILLLSNGKFNPLFILSLIGVYILSMNNKETFSNKEEKESDSETFKQTQVKENFKYEGIVAIILAAFTEAIIYFIIRDIKTTNNWNHIFISYFFGAIGLSVLFFNEIKKVNIRNTLTISVLINGIIGLLGYVLRFYATTRLPTKLYTSLSYFGVIMSYIYGIFISKDILSLTKVLGTLCIVIPNLIILFTQN